MHRTSDRCDVYGIYSDGHDPGEGILARDLIRVEASIKPDTIHGFAGFGGEWHRRVAESSRKVGYFFEARSSSTGYSALNLIGNVRRRPTTHRQH